MKTILVPTDFSKSARNAAEYAVQLAEKMKAKVLLFHAYHLPPILSAAIVERPISPAVLQKANEALLKKEMNHLKKKGKVEISCLAKFGMAADEIKDLEKHVDLIVIGMKGKDMGLDMLLGSLATKILRESSIPVIAIPAEAKYKNPEKIVFSCDYDPRTGANVFAALKDLMKIFAPKIYVLNIKNKKESVSLEKAKTINPNDKLGEIEHVYYFPKKEDLAEGINEFVEEHKADMIAVVPHRYSLWEGMFHKSITKKISFHTHVPLLAMPDSHKSVAAFFL